MSALLAIKPDSFADIYNRIAALGHAYRGMIVQGTQFGTVLDMNGVGLVASTDPKDVSPLHAEQRKAMEAGRGRINELEHQLRLAARELKRVGARAKAQRLANDILRGIGE